MPRWAQVQASPAGTREVGHGQCPLLPGSFLSFGIYPNINRQWPLCALFESYLQSQVIIEMHPTGQRPLKAKERLIISRIDKGRGQKSHLGLAFAPSHSRTDFASDAWELCKTVKDSENFVTWSSESEAHA